MKKILVTGVAGFIGMHTAKKLLELNHKIIGIDNLNNYYDKNLKLERVKVLRKYKKFFFQKIDIADRKKILNFIKKTNPDIVVNLAAQAGVRYSLAHPEKYITANVVGFLNILDACKMQKVKHLVYASSSSVYGLSKKIDFSEDDNIDHPISIYAATKKSNESMAHVYSYLYNLPTTALRFFTVYGPWGRPDMALFKFTKSILKNKKIDVYNYGNMMRSYTYIDDAVEAVIKIIFKIPKKNPSLKKRKIKPSESLAPFKILNVGSNKKVNLMEYIKAIEKKLNKKSKKNFMPLQMGDIISTSANSLNLKRWINFKPKTTVKEGIDKFVDWYLSYYKHR